MTRHTIIRGASHASPLVDADLTRQAEGFGSKEFDPGRYLLLAGSVEHDIMFPGLDALAVDTLTLEVVQLIVEEGNGASVPTVVDARPLPLAAIRTMLDEAGRGDHFRTLLPHLEERAAPVDAPGMGKSHARDAHDFATRHFAGLDPAVTREAIVDRLAGITGDLRPVGAASVPPDAAIDGTPKAGAAAYGDASPQTLLPTILSAESLWSRYGFGDGNPFVFADRGPAFDDEPYPPLQEAIAALNADARADLVEALVATHLVPEIARVTGEEPAIVRIGTHHNQVRDARLGHGSSPMPEAWEDIEVTVTPDQVADALARLGRRAPATSSPTPPDHP